MNELELPAQAMEVIDRLNAYHYQAYIVGECVRDLIRGERPMDYDIITDAYIDRILAIFGSYRINDDRAASGEIIIMVKGMAIMVSPFIVNFEDGKPIPTRRITEDLSRRDFSANAIAYSPINGFVDPFKGIDCLQGELVTLKAIGESKENVPITNINQTIGAVSSIVKNPMNILTAMKYFSEGGYEISAETADTMRRNAESLKVFPEEKLKEWFDKILMGKNIADTLIGFKEIVFVVFPELKAIDNFDQHSQSHDLTLYEHVCKAVGSSPPEKTIRYALLFHGLGKPDCEAVCGGESYHTYYGHAERAAILADRIMKRLDFSKDRRDRICLLIRNHDYPICQIADDVKQALEIFEPGDLKLLLQSQAADLRAKKGDNEIIVQNLKRLAENVFQINGDTLTSNIKIRNTLFL